MKESPQPSQAAALITTGIEGFDDVLNGGLVANRLYLVEGYPGSGKTTLALQFLLAGARCGEPCMFVTLSETKQELQASAASHGWTLDGIHVQEVLVSEDSLAPDAQYTMFHPAEVELAETTKAVLAEAERVRPVRLVFDSLSELRLLAENPLRYRRQILALKQYFARRDVTVLFIDDRTVEERDMHLHSLVHGVITLRAETAEYGVMRRRLEIRKLRGRAFREGFHDFSIRRGGIRVYPRLIAAEHRSLYAREAVPSGLGSLDALLGGGLPRGTATLITGPAGTGKSSLAALYAWSAVERGEHVSLYLFDEAIATFLERSAGLGMDWAPHLDAGRAILQQVDPAELSPGEFVHAVREAVEKNQTRMVLIDSLNGYLNAMPNEQYLLLNLHELFTYLGQKGVTSLLLMVQHGLVGTMYSTVDVSYIADNVLLLRYFEITGEIRTAISVVKKRTGRHERTIRELRLDGGISIGEPMHKFQGVLTGVPQVLGAVHSGGNDA